MDYSALKTEIAQPAYAGMTDQQIADTLNAVTIAIKIDVRSPDVRGTLYSSGAWRNIVGLSLDGKTGVAAHDAALVAAKQLIDFCATAEPFATSIAAILSEVTTDLAALVTQGTITSNDQAAVLGLTDSKVSRASQIGWPAGVSTDDVAHARSL